MKKVIVLALVLSIILSGTGLTACAGREGGVTWKDIPIYPGAELKQASTWTILPEDEPWSEVEWRYYLAADKYSASEVISFYHSEILAEGWQDISGMDLIGIEEFLWNYRVKINPYISPDIVGRLGDWGYYSKNNEQDWAAIWIGINKEWEEADKIFIVIMIAR